MLPKTEWTAERDAQLRSLIERKVSITEIASTMLLARSTIRKRAQDLGLRAIPEPGANQNVVGVTPDIAICSTARRANRARCSELNRERRADQAEQRSREMTAFRRQQRGRRVGGSAKELAALARQAVESGSVPVVKLRPGFHVGWKLKHLY